MVEERLAAIPLPPPPPKLSVESAEQTTEVAEETAKFDRQFIERLHSTLVAESSAGCHIGELIKSYKTDWSKDLRNEARTRGYSTVLDMLKDMPQEVSVVDDHVRMVKKEVTKSTLDLVDHRQFDDKNNKKKMHPPKQALKLDGLFSSQKSSKAYLRASNLPNGFGGGAARRPSVNDMPIRSNNNFFGHRSAAHTTNSNGFQPNNGWEPSMFGRQQQKPQPARQVHNQLDRQKQTRARNLNDFGDYDDLSFERGENIPLSGLDDEEEEEGDHYQDNQRHGSEDGLDEEDELDIFEGGDEEFASDEEEEEFFFSADDEEAMQQDEYEWTGEEQCCSEFDNEFLETKPIPPKLYRMVCLLKEHGGEVDVETLRGEYKRVYTTTLTISELRNVLGVEDPVVKLTKVAFARCPLASMFKWRNSASGFISLATHDNDDKISVTGSSCPNQSIGTGSVSGGLNSRFSRMSMYSLSSTRDTTPTVKGGEQEQLPSGTTTPAPAPFSCASRKLGSSSLSETALCLLRMATMAHDLARHSPTALERLLKELRDMGNCYAPFTRSPAQMVGLLLKYFEKCFTITSTKEAYIHISSTEMSPKNVVECLEGVPRRLCDLPWADKSIRLVSHQEAVLVSYDGSSPENLSFNFHVGASSIGIYDQLNVLLRQYDRLLRDMEEPCMAQLHLNQLCLYRGDAGQLVRCRVMFAKQSEQPILQNIDNGELIFGDACNKNIFQFPTQMSIDRFPPMAVQAGFGRILKFRDAERFERMEKVLKRLIEQRVVVKLLIVSEDINAQKQLENNISKTFKVRLIVYGEGGESRVNRYPDDLLLP